MVKRILIPALALLIFTGCTDPVSVDSEAPAAAARIDRVVLPGL